MVLVAKFPAAGVAMVYSNRHRRIARRPHYRAFDRQILRAVLALDYGSGAVADWTRAWPLAVALFTTVPSERFLDRLGQCPGSFIHFGGWRVVYQPGRANHGSASSGGNHRAGAGALVEPISP